MRWLHGLESSRERISLSVTSGAVTLSTSSPTLVYETPDGVVTNLIVQVDESSNNNAWFWGSSVTSSTGVTLDENTSPLVLNGFQGSLYGLAQDGGTTAVYLAADMR